MDPLGLLEKRVGRMCCAQPSRRTMQGRARQCMSVTARCQPSVTQCAVQHMVHGALAEFCMNCLQPERGRGLGHLRGVWGRVRIGFGRQAITAIRLRARFCLCQRECAAGTSGVSGRYQSWSGAHHCRLDESRRRLTQTLLGSSCPRNGRHCKVRAYRYSGPEMCCEPTRARIGDGRPALARGRGGPRRGANDRLVPPYEHMDLDSRAIGNMRQKHNAVCLVS